jgi:hypothetical protein
MERKSNSPVYRMKSSPAKFLNFNFGGSQDNSRSKTKNVDKSKVKTKTKTTGDKSFFGR